jgi:predicted amino acid racemase
MNPQVEINVGGILRNLRVLKQLAAEQGIRVSAVTKGFSGYAPLLQILVENGVDSICEARVQTLKKFAPYTEGVEKWLIRLPLPSEAADVVRYADVSLNSELATVRKLSKEAVHQHREHRVVLMAELGELREGCFPDELLAMCEACEKLPGVELHGIGANLGCFNEIVPDEDNMGALAQAAEDIETMLGRRLAVVSGGSSSTIRMLEERALPKKINHLRIGEAALLGNIVCYDKPFAGASTGNFILSAEVIESKEKPAAPWGMRVDAASGKRHVVGRRREAAEYEGLRDVGPSDFSMENVLAKEQFRKRVLLAVGYQDLDLREAVPLDAGLQILGVTSDCSIADVEDCERSFAPGDSARFSLRYHAAVQAMAAESVRKIPLRI